MTDENAPESAAPESPAADDAPTWTPPATLSPPAAQQSRLPVPALALGLGVAVACGVGLWASSQAFYIYILYNALIGGALGWALGFAPRKSGFTNVPVLVGVGVALCVVPYVVMRYGMFLQLLPELQAQGYDPSFLQFFVFFLEAKTLFGMEIGLFGNIAVLLVEIGITVTSFYGRLQQAIAAARIASVPHDVVSFVVNGLAQGWDTPALREELSARGWKSADDQDRAIGTGFDVIASMEG